MIKDGKNQRSCFWLTHYLSACNEFKNVEPKFSDIIFLYALLFLNSEVRNSFQTVSQSDFLDIIKPVSSAFSSIAGCLFNFILFRCALMSSVKSAMLKDFGVFCIVSSKTVLDGTTVIEREGKYLPLILSNRGIDVEPAIATLV